MSDAADAERDVEPRAATSGSRRLLPRIRLAASFLTILPIAPADPADPGDVAASFGFFPLIGFAIGATLCALDWSLSPILNSSLRAILIIAALTVVTGAIHLDGLADSADALGAGRDRARALAIMRDSRIGGFGAIALVFILTLKFVALATAGAVNRRAALILAPGLGRWAMVAVAAGMDYLRAGGAGAALLERDRDRNLRIATIIAIAGAVVVARRPALISIIVTGAITLAMRGFYRRWLGGVTGDLIGAAGEIVETAVLIALAR